MKKYIWIIVAAAFIMYCCSDNTDSYNDESLFSSAPAFLDVQEKAVFVLKHRNGSDQVSAVVLAWEGVKEGTMTLYEDGSAAFSRYPGGDFAWEYVEEPITQAHGGGTLRYLHIVSYDKELGGLHNPFYEINIMEDGRIFRDVYFGLDGQNDGYVGDATRSK